MPLITGQITRFGAHIDVLVGVSKNLEKAMRKEGRRIPDTIPVCAVIDTGASVSGFMPWTFEKIGVEPFRTIPVRTASTKPNEPCWSPQYDISVSLVSGMSIQYLPSVHAILTSDFGEDEGVQALIGRDILNCCVFQYYGPHKNFTLSF